MHVGPFLLVIRRLVVDGRDEQRRAAGTDGRGVVADDGQGGLEQRGERGVVKAGQGEILGQSERVAARGRERTEGELNARGDQCGRPPRQGGVSLPRGAARCCG